MDSSADASDELRRLRRTMRDLVALSTLPAIWTGLGPEGIARSLADALLNTLSLDLIYVRLAGQADECLIEVARSSRNRNTTELESMRSALEPLLKVDGNEASGTIPDPCGTGMLHIALTRFGVSSDYGILVAGSRNAEFPSDQDRLLLGVGANQTAIVIQRRRAEQRVRDQQEWLRVTLASIGDAVIATDTQGRVTFVNEVAQELTGWSAENAHGQHLAEVFTILNEQTRQPVESPVEKVLRDGTIVGLANHTVLIAKDGTERPIDDSAAPIRDATGNLIGVVLTFRDVTQQRQAERQRNARLAVTQALNEAAGVADRTSRVLQAVCENLGWDVGFCWIVNDNGETLECRASWQKPDVAVEDFVSDTCHRTFDRGEGLPGRTWATAESNWILDIELDSNFPRLASAVKNGLHSAFAYPVAVGDHMLGVIEFFTHRIREADPGLLEMMGTVAGNLGQFIEREAAQEELRRSESELADFFENATIGLHWVGPDGTILRANRAELDMLGYGRGEYVGRKITEFHADDEVICDILSRLQAGEKLESYPARLRCKDGSIKDVLIDSSVLWNQGQFIHTRCFTRDITERKSAEAALADARSRLDAALEAGAITTWTWDIPTNRLYAEQSLARLFNLAPSAADGGSVDRYIESIHPEDRPAVIAALKRSVDSGDDYEADYRIVDADGSVRWVTARGRAVLDAGGRPVSMPGVLVDITERKRLEDELRLRVEQLAEADRRKDEFLATLAHELRNPLAPIRNSLQILKMSRVDETTVQQTRDMMERQVDHLVRLVDDLLDVSRVMRGKIELRKAPIELATIVARAVETVQPLIQAQGHSLKISVPEESLLLDADPVRLAQVLGNLLTNSAKYTESNGQIWVTAHRENDQAVLRVRDNGIGIAPDMLPHVFELFVQADHTSTRAQGGLGIGLTLVNNLVKLHGGSITAHSTGLNEGAEFVIRLPLMLAARPSREQKDDGGQRRDKQLPGYSLLVVDDNVDSAMSLAKLLRLMRHDVKVAHDGVSAIEVAKSYLPDLIFLDIGMPGMDGYDVAHRIRSTPGLERTVLAALTGWGQEEDRRRTAEAGFNHHLVKPLEPKALEQVLSDLRRKKES
jgi:PAS domain S-box-containing protein